MIRTNLVALLALVPAFALGQAGAPPAPGAAPIGGPPVQAPADTRGVEPLPPDDGAAVRPEGSATAADDGKGTVPPPDTYTVKPGDTLWDLSGRFLNNPWYWPKIWSYNPEITNPHWIYPGNLLKFFPAAEEAPARVEPAAEGAPAQPEQPIAEAGQEEEVAEPVKELEDFSKADMKVPAPVEETDAVAVAGPYKIGHVPPKTRFARRDTFVTPRELEESGAITAAFEEKIMLSTGDRAYARFQRQADVKVGETYVVFKTERPIRHPVSHEVFGYQSQVLGAAKVVAVDDRSATVTIESSFEPIERGAMLGPWTQKFYRPVDRRPNAQAIAGNIIGAQVDVVTQLGEHQVVFVDRGEKDGVQEGNVFTVIRAGDLYGRDPMKPVWDPSLPVEPIGEMLIVDVKENASAALVTKSLKELMIGDRVEMRPAAGSGGN